MGVVDHLGQHFIHTPLSNSWHPFFKFSHTVMQEAALEKQIDLP